MDYKQIIQAGLDYIEENLKTALCPEELAAQAGFSVYHYYRLFHAATGLPVMQYILRRRLLHAIYEMRRGRSGIDTALDYGFDTYAGFYRAFQREFSCTPASFLKFCKACRPYRINLMKEEHMIISHKKARQILKYWNLEGQKITDIYYDGTGSRNENACYAGDQYVLKYTANPGKLQKHIALSRALEGAGLCAATAVVTADGQDYVRDGELYFYLTRRLSGRQMAAAELYTNGRADYIGEIIGRLHLALGSIDLPVDEADLFAAVKDWALPKAQEAMDLDRTFCLEWLENFGNLYRSLPRQIIHRDTNPGNMICDGDRWGFIDFELSENNVRIYDPCYAATAVLSETYAAVEQQPEDWLAIYRDIIMGYDRIVKLTDAEREAVPYIILANQLVCVAWFAQEEKYAELFETNKRMTVWILAHLDDMKIK